ncbi:hypothetical protein [Rufibacter immobilis]|uniref:hypothetical protein n=1 Tax=Rufibacter immobilis TaxID=1348778 RepID=UPI001C83A866|nr:hypothetical protein [Rufibacter immobilis]
MIEVHGPMVPLKSVLELLDCYQEGTLEAFLDQRDLWAPKENRTTYQEAGGC